MPGNVNSHRLKYTGKKQPKPRERDADGLPIEPYVPEPELVDAVNLAICLKRPLLIKGEPGCGKTRLARAVAYELKLPYEAWHIKSTSQARDGLYIYDTVGRLRDAQLAAVKKTGLIDYASKYVHLGPLGRALSNEKRTVVLIDEIDKADIDFPNDLLLELDEKRFKIIETNQEIRAKEGTEPIIFITSNDEKDLPDAFLRRCLFHYVEFPDYERLIEIIKYHFRDAHDELVRKAVGRFKELRDQMVVDKGKTAKKVSTSELIDWFSVLNTYPKDVSLAKVDGKIPASVLLKSLEDHLRYMDLLGPKVSS